MVNISSQYTSTQNSYWLRALAPFFNCWTFKLQLNQISIGTTMWCSEQIKYQWHTRISICLIYEFAEVQLTWPQLIWPQLFSSLPGWAGFCLCSQLAAGGLSSPPHFHLLLCWDWLATGFFRMATGGTTGAIPVCSG